MDKVYRRFYQHELAEYQFTPNEIAVILFLYNNAPDLDTATDIVRCKGISKGLVARSVDSLWHIQSVLKRAYHTESSKTIEHKGVVLDVSKSLVRFKDRQVDLTKNELRILYILMDNRDTIISRDDIMSDLWQSDEFVDDNTLTVNINRLRKKLEGIGIEDFLVTKRGQGYMV